MEAGGGGGGGDGGTTGRSRQEQERGEWHNSQVKSSISSEQRMFHMSLSEQTEAEGTRQLNSFVHLVIRHMQNLSFADIL